MDATEEEKASVRGCEKQRYYLFKVVMLSCKGGRHLCEFTSIDNTCFDFSFQNDIKANFVGQTLNIKQMEILRLYCQCTV